VLSTCEHFGLRDGAGGVDRAESYTSAKSHPFDALSPDGEGGWQIYWRQSFPGLDNPAHSVSGEPMPNWWPYIYY
jgi:hypothetical protein